MKITLSKASIKNAIDALDFLKDNIKVANEDIVETLVGIGFKTASDINESSPQSGLTKSEVIQKITEAKTKGYVALVGPGAIYDEFGTGDEGASDPHPMKNDFPLNPYNSGPTIFYNQSIGKNQWHYGPMAGKPYFTDTGLTSGIPSGKQIYNASKEVRARKDDVIAKELNSAVRKTNKK